MEFRRTFHVDVTDHERTPAEESLYESYLLRKNSNIGNLYSSNVYEGQCFEKTIKQLNKDKRMQVAEIDREMRILEKRMNQLKTKSTNGRLLKDRSETLGCVKDLTLNTKESPSGLPFLSPKDSPQGRRSHLFSRAMSDASLHNAKDEGKASRRAISPSMPTINITTWNQDSSDISTEEDNKGGKNAKEENAHVSTNDKYPIALQKKKGESFFITDVKDFESYPSPKSKRITIDSPRQRSPSPSILSPGDKLPIDITQNRSPSLSRAIHMSKSDDDIISMNDRIYVPLHRRPRAHTISGNLTSGTRDEDLSAHDTQEDDRSPTLVLPKI